MQAPRVPLPFDAPDSILRDVIYVSDLAEIASEAGKLRARKLDQLFERYMIQIQYGCKNPACATPTCLSCRRRLSKGPLRKYTTLSARTLASSLISARNPEAALCGNEPNGPRRGPEQTETMAKSKWRGGVLRSSEDVNWMQTNGTIKSRRRPSDSLSDFSASSPHQKLHLLSSMQEGQQRSTFCKREVPHILAARECSNRATKKDPKSFVQNLFDSFSLSNLLSWITISPGSVPSVNSNFQGSIESVTTETGSVQDARSRTRSSESSQNSYSEASPFQQLQSFAPQGDTPFDEVKEEIETEHKEDTSEPVSGDLEKRWQEIDSLDDLSALFVTQTGTPHTRVSSDGFQNTEVDNDSRSAVLSVEPPPESSSILVVPTLCRLSPGAFMWIEEALQPKTKVSSLKDLAEVVGYSTPEQLQASLRAARNNPEVHGFIAQSVYFILKNPGALLASTYGWHTASHGNHPQQTCLLEPTCTLNFLRSLHQVTSLENIHRQVNLCLQTLYAPPPWLQALQQRRRISITSSIEAEAPDTNEQGCWQPISHVPDKEAALICALGLYLLTSYFFEDWKTQIAPTQSEYLNCETFHQDFPITWWERRRLRALPLFEQDYHQLSPKVAAGVDLFDDVDACRLFQTIMELISTRNAFHEISTSRKSDKSATETDFGFSIARNFATPASALFKDLKGETLVPRPHPTSYSTIHWCRNLLFKNWNGTPVVRRASPQGGCLSFLATMYKHRQLLNLEPEIFYMDFIAAKLDTVEMPLEWLKFRAQSKDVHFLSYSFLFRPATLVAYFRAVNYSIMSKAFEEASRAEEHSFGWTHNYTNSRRWTGPNGPYLVPPVEASTILAALAPQTERVFVLTISRGSVLKDAIDQVWRCQRRELMRPLKVILGKDEGEEGMDLGGPQQEFFGVLLAEALDPAYGMFTIDPQTRMTWFQPLSMEPLYKFEVLGILASIAVYNSITLPITFPLAFYRQLLGLKVKKLSHISDGWPVLAKGMQSMLDWEEGDVEDTFARTYEFGYEAFGEKLRVDMEKVRRDDPWPPMGRKKGKEKLKTTSFEIPLRSELTPPEDVSPPAQSPGVTLEPNGEIETGHIGSLTPASVPSEPAEDDASMVTNANREQYVKDYIFWLTDKSVRPQFAAFAKGFYTCLDRTALSLFTPEALKTVIEGHFEIDIEGLQKVTKYTEYTAESEVVKWFWEVVLGWEKEKHKQLLEFVTASDRVPVNGVSSVSFTIQRNGSGDLRLPTSTTCFGTLLLPEYGSKAVLSEKLGKAVEFGKGFGVQ